jgi:hypothetical protein
MNSNIIDGFCCSFEFLKDWANCHWKPSTGKFLAGHHEENENSRYFRHIGDKVVLNLREYGGHLATGDLKCRVSQGCISEFADINKNSINGVYALRPPRIDVDGGYITEKLSLSDVRNWSELDDSLLSWWITDYDQAGDLWIRSLWEDMYDCNVVQ